MKAVLLAAGKSTRTYPLTLDTPKPLLEIFGRPLMSYTIEGLMDVISEWVIITNYKAELVQQYVQETYPNLVVHFHVQKDTDGTGGALRDVQHLLGNEKFLVLNGDDLYHPKDLMVVIQDPHAYNVVGQKTTTPERFGVFRLENDRAVELVEKPTTFVSDLANIGVYTFDGAIWNHELVRSPRGEYEIIDYVNYLFQQRKEVKVHTVQEYWLPITYPWDVLNAQRTFFERADIRHRIDPTATVDVSAYIGQNVYIGKNAVIGAEVELENVCVGEGVHIDDYARVHGSVLSMGTHVKEGAIIDGREATDIQLPISAKEPVAVEPSYKGVFTAPKTIVEGYHLTPAFLL